MTKLNFLNTFLLSAALLSSCGVPAGNSSLDTDTPQMKSVNLQFKAVVNQQEFSCTDSFKKVGTSASTLTPKDFRFYVHDVHLMTDSGQAVPVELEQDGKWQVHNVALLDFEDKTGTCESGTTDTRFQIKGNVPEGEYKGLQFKLGVPAAMNHGDPNMAPSPLNLTSMFWTWRSGHKFARIDMATTGQPKGYFIHLGSTGCAEIEGATQAEGDAHGGHSIKYASEDHSGPEIMTQAAATSCDNPNIATVNFADFDTENNVIVADLGALLSDTDIDVNQPETAAGCMSSPDDADCQDIFKNMGLSDVEQTFFSKQ